MEELIRKLTRTILKPEEARLLEQILKEDVPLKNGDLTLIIEILNDFAIDGYKWARRLKKKAIKRLKKVRPKNEAEKRYLEKIIKEYSW